MRSFITSAIISAIAVTAGIVGSAQSAKAISAFDYGYLKGCGMLVSQQKHGTTKLWRRYFKSEMCKQKLESQR